MRWASGCCECESTQISSCKLRIHSVWWKAGMHSMSFTCMHTRGFALRREIYDVCISDFTLYCPHRCLHCLFIWKGNVLANVICNLYVIFMWMTEGWIFWYFEHFQTPVFNVLGQGGASCPYHVTVVLKAVLIFEFKYYIFVLSLPFEMLGWFQNISIKHTSSYLTI